MTALLDTTGSTVVKALAAARRTAGGVTSGLALTLVVVTDEQDAAEAEAAAVIAAAAHPCRLLLVVRREISAPKPRLDAEISVGERLGPGEAVVMRMYGRLALHAESVVLPLLAPDVPVVTWWNGQPPNVIAEDPLGVLADRRITDCAHCDDPITALRQRAIDFAPGDTDIAWTRASPWRSLLAGAFDTVDSPAVSARIATAPHVPTAILLAGWLRDRLGIDTELINVPGDTVAEVAVALANGDEITISWHNGDPSTNSAVVRRTGLPDRRMPLRRRPLGERLAEELRHLDPDEPYAAALSAAMDIPNLANRPRHRNHIWHDPALSQTDLRSMSSEAALSKASGPHQPGNPS